jgi:hypothetical protein
VPPSPHLLLACFVACLLRCLIDCFVDCLPGVRGADGDGDAPVLERLGGEATAEGGVKGRPRTTPPLARVDGVRVSAFAIVMDSSTAL